MTREEAIKILKEIIDEGWLISDFDKCIAIDACEMAIKALEQELCEDAISREEVIDTIFRECSYENLDIDFIKVLLLRRKIKALPPVTLQSKMGHWIRVVDKTGHLVWKCDKCDWQQRFNTNFCPDCGARMVESQNLKYADNDTMMSAT